MNNKVSIIIPTYNAVKYVKNAYKSICKQSLDNIEIIFVDDGSEDATLKLLENISTEDERVRFFACEHKGSGAARNFGINKANGEYVAFLDSDDEYVDVGALEKLYDQAHEHNAIAAAGFRIVLAYEREYKEPLFRDVVFGDEECKFVDFIDYQEDYHYQNYIFNREFLLGNQLFFPDYLRYQDPVFCLQVMDKAKKVLVVPVEMYMYRVGQQNPEVIDNNIADCLQGILDNLRIADTKGYALLYKKLIDRITYDYYVSILSNLDYRVMRILAQILLLNDKSEFKQHLYILDDVPEVMKRWIIFDSDRTYEDRVDKALNNRDAVEHYFLRRNIRAIAIYGAGKYGIKLVSALIDSRISVVAMFDKNYENITLPSNCSVKLASPEEVSKIEHDAVVVSPIRYGDMAKRMSNLGEQRVFILRAIVDEVISEE